MTSALETRATSVFDDDDDDKMDEPLMIISIFPVTTLALATLATLVFGQSHKRLESAPSSELGGFVVNLLTSLSAISFFIFM